MANGSTKPIEDVVIGDAVKAYDVETGTLVENQVTQYYEYAAETYLIINGDLKITKLHPVYSHGEWVEIGKLKVGDSLTNDQGQPLIIDSIQETNEKVNVYNLEVSPDNTYIAWGIIVHNKPPGACPIPAE